MADNKNPISQEEFDRLTEKISDVADIKLKETLEDYRNGVIDFNKVMKDLSRVYKTEKSAIQEKVRQELELSNALKARKEYIKKVTQEELQKQNAGPKQSFLQRIGFTEKTQQDQLAAMYRARQMSSGIEQMLSGNFFSGARQMLSTIPKVANFMGGPYYLALELAVKGLMKFDEALSKSTKNMASVTGGLTSEYVGNRFKSFGAYHNLKESLREIGLQGNIEEVMKSISSSYGVAYAKNNLQDLVKISGYAQQGLGSLGISQQSSQGLISNLQLIEGKSTQGVYAQLQRLTDRFSKMSMFSPEQALQQATSLYDQTKHLGTNFEWASRMVARFEKGLKDGTLALSDFAAVNKSMRSGNISSNAGIAALVADYASRSGIQLPSGFTNSNILGQSYAVSTKAMLSNNQFARAYQGQIQEMLDQIGGTTKEERAGALQTILQSRGINISTEAAGNAIKANGQIDLIGQGIIGSKMGQKEEKERLEAEQYQKQVRDYYTGTATYQDLMKRWMGGIYNKFVGNSVATGISEGMSTDSTDLIRNFTAVFAHPINNLNQFIDNTKYVLEKLSNNGISIDIKNPNQ